MNFLKVHIIDDDQSTADLLGEFADLMGYETQVYTRAKSFFENNAKLIGEHLLILDLHMPEMDGIEVMRELVRHALTPHLILISGFDKNVLHSAEQLAHAHSLNVIATLTKPLSLKVLQNTLNFYLENKVAELAYQGKESIQPLAGELEDAILERQFVLYFQPQIDIKTNQLFGVEALIRWQHPQFGLIFPDSFIPLAEQSGLLGDITAFVIKDTVEQLVQWREQGLNTKVSINISAENIKSLVFPEQLIRMLEKYHLDPSVLSLEVTESAVMEELATSLDILTRVRMKGISLSIDDFGIGHSSLSQLYRVPFNELKVDRSFVMKMSQNEEAKGIVKMCIMLAHELDMQVVAEGVEDAETLSLLESMGCDLAQGYFIAKPMPAEQFFPWLQNYSS